jgi:hypothetical protein
MRHLDEQDGARVLEQLRHRSGVLRSPAVGRVDFVHRTFQEYLAAEEAAEEDRIGNLVERAHLDLWRETIIMAAGHANRPQREELLGGILDRAEVEPRHARKLRLLAAACQETVPEVSEGLAGRLDEAVEALLPPRRETDAPALAAVGTSLLRSLPRSLSGLTEKAAAQTVRTVALIGGEEALALLEEYAQDPPAHAVRALLNGWNYFDADAYVDRILSRLSLEDQRVHLTHAGQWRPFLQLHSVTSFSIDYPFEDFTTIGELPQLRQLFCFELRGEVDLSVLQAHTSLEFLMLSGDLSMSLTGLEALGELPELGYLLLGLNDSSDLSDLRLGPKVKQLSLVSRTEKPCLPRGLESVIDSPGLALSLHSVDVAAWLNSPGFFVPKVKRLSLYDCVLPDALDFPGVDVLVH